MYKELEFEKYKNFVKINEYNDFGSKYLISIINKNIGNNQRIIPRIRMTKENSILNVAKENNILFSINAGIFNTKTLEPECVLIRKGKVLIDRNETYIHKSPEDGEEKRNSLYIMGITFNGDLKFYLPETSTQDILKECVDAIMGFVPLIENYKEINEDERCFYISKEKNKRQIIGQLENDDYIIMSVIDGMTLDECRKVLSKFNVKNAYNLDGGKSTQSVFYKELLTPIFVEENGRRVPTMISFEVIDGELEIHNEEYLS